MKMINSTNLEKCFLKLDETLSNYQENNQRQKQQESPLIKREEFKFALYSTILFLIMKMIDYILFDANTKDILIALSGVICCTISLNFNQLMIYKCIIFMYAVFNQLLVIALYKSSIWIMFLPIQIWINPSIIFILTKSLIAALVCMISNMLVSYIFVQPMVVSYFKGYTCDSYLDLSKWFISYCIKWSLYFIMVNAVLMHNRMAIINKMNNKEKELNDINMKLVKTNKELEEALEDQNNLLLSVSHEARNPLNGILGNLDLVLSYVKNDEILYKPLKNARSSGEIMLYFLNNLLDAGKMKANDLEVSYTASNVRTFIEKMWSITKVLVEKKNLLGEVYVSREIPERLLIDQHRLVQIMFNLIGNAAKFTNQGYVKIIISWSNTKEFKETLLEPTKIFDSCNSYTASTCSHRTNTVSVQATRLTTSGNHNHTIDQLTDVDLDEDDFFEKEIRLFAPKSAPWSNLKDDIILNGYIKLDMDQASFVSDGININFDKSVKKQEYGYLKIEVIDSGCGMPKEALKKLFQKFGQVSGMTQEKKLGSGLGLWITRELCRKMGGDIRAFSKVNQGSIFIAAVKCKVMNYIPPLNILPQVNQPFFNGNQQIRAMVVDDDRTNQEMIKGFLQRCGVIVTDVADNGQEAVDIYIKRGSNFFDLIFIDLEMPVMNGKTACIKIRQKEVQGCWKPAEIVIVSGNYIQNEIELCLTKTGGIRANHFFAKPFTLTQCRSFIENYKKRMQSEVSSLDHIAISKEPSVVVQKKKLSQTAAVIQEPVNNTKPKEGKILVVDDDIWNCKIIGNYLDLLKLDYIFAHDGASALNIVHTQYQSIRLIFMDGEMPIMDGYEATRQIKAFLNKMNYDNIAIYGVSGHETKEHREKCKEAGMKDIIVKPISFEKIKEILQYGNL